MRLHVLSVPDYDACFTAICTKIHDGANWGNLTSKSNVLLNMRLDFFQEGKMIEKISVEIPYLSLVSVLHIELVS